MQLAFFVLSAKTMVLVGDGFFHFVNVLERITFPTKRGCSCKRFRKDMKKFVVTR